MSTKHTDVVAEYLGEVDRRLAGLPVLQRRELLADLTAHIENERAGRDLGEGRLIEVLERLGSPEAIAAAAHEEAGATGAVEAAEAAPPRRPVRLWPILAIVAGVVVLLALCAGFMFFAQDSSDSPPAPAITTR